MRVIEDHGLTEDVLVKVLGWKWMSYVGRPTSDTEGYPGEMRVRQLMSPGQIKSKRWREFLEGSEGREADGTEPLSYRYCSSVGPAVPPKVYLLIDDRFSGEAE